MSKKKSMPAFKGFDKDLKCRGYQFRVGRAEAHEGDVKICCAGFHSCENPLDVLGYYDLCDSRFASVAASGKELKPDTWYKADGLELVEVPQ